MRNDVRTSTVRTTVPAVWLGALVAVVNWIWGFDLTVAELAPWAPVLGVVYGILYRGLREIEQRFPTVGRIIFGSGQTPEYYENI